jgi:hypothetical protein
MWLICKPHKHKYNSCLGELQISTSFPLLLDLHYVHYMCESFWFILSIVAYWVISKSSWQFPLCMALAHNVSIFNQGMFFYLRLYSQKKKSENHLLTVMKTISTLLWKKPFILFNEIIIHLLNCSHYSWRGILWNWSHFIMLLESFVVHKAFVDTMFFNTLKLNVFFVTKTFI